MDTDGSSAVPKGSLSTTRKLKRKKEEGPELPSDVLRTITKKLHINDLISFGQVCKNWRRHYFDSLHNFMESQAPLILQKTPHAKRACSLYSISDERSYNVWLSNFSGFSFVGFSSGYIIMTNLLTIMLINPFIRKTITIPKPKDMSPFIDRAALAFDFDSEEFILVTLFSISLHMHVYISENSTWHLLSRDGTPMKIMDMALQSMIFYVITDKAEVGIVKLDKNSQRLRFLKLYDKPSFAIISTDLKLVISNNNKLLVVDFEPFQHLAIYKIEPFKEWKRVETLRDCALFLGEKTNFSLSNASKWGFESDFVYYIDQTSSACKVISLDNQVIRTIALPESQGPHQRAKLKNISWCFRPQCEVWLNFML